MKDEKVSKNLQLCSVIHCFFIFIIFSLMKKFQDKKHVLYALMFANPSALESEKLKHLTNTRHTCLVVETKSLSFWSTEGEKKNNKKPNLPESKLPCYVEGNSGTQTQQGKLRRPKYKQSNKQGVPYQKYFYPTRTYMQPKGTQDPHPV